MKKLAPLIILSVIACAHPGPKDQPGPEAPRIEWRIDTMQRNQEQPIDQLEISINGVLHLIDPKVPCPLQKLNPEDYQAHGVPKNAVIACSGWWAGAGNEFYAKVEGDHLAIYSREMDEAVPGIPGYKKIKVIALAKS